MPYKDNQKLQKSLITSQHTVRGFIMGNLIGAKVQTDPWKE